MPRKFAQLRRWEGRRNKKTVEMIPTVRRETKDATPTMTASRLRGVSGERCSGGGFANASLGKKTRKSTILYVTHQYIGEQRMAKMSLT
jgi:hypothetical protein